DDLRPPHLVAGEPATFLGVLAAEFRRLLDRLHLTHEPHHHGLRVLRVSVDSELVWYNLHNDLLGQTASAVATRSRGVADDDCTSGASFCPGSAKYPAAIRLRR